MVLSGLKLMMVYQALTFSSAYGFTQCIEDASKRYGINPYILYAIAKVESGFNPRAVNYNRNGTVDYGLFQINSSNLKRLGIPVWYAYDPCYSAYLGAYFLRQCIDVYGNSWRAVDCYNKGNKASHSSKYVWLVYRELKRAGVVD